jgi:hypothetical protein
MSNKKRKVNFEDDINIDIINEDNYLEIDLEKHNEKLNKLKIYYENEIIKIKEKIRKTNFLISKKCIHENKKHVWITEREPCMYGEKYTYCKNCKVDYYDRYFLH